MTEFQQSTSPKKLIISFLILYMEQVLMLKNCLVTARIRLFFQNIVFRTPKYACFFSFHTKSLKYIRTDVSKKEKTEKMTHSWKTAREILPANNLSPVWDEFGHCSSPSPTLFWLQLKDGLALEKILGTSYI